MYKNPSLVKSLAAAFKGFRDVILHERSFRKMLIAGVLALVLMIYFPTTRVEKLILLTMIFAVLTLELINSVIERIMDFVHLDHHEKVGEIKDMMAAVVLMVSIAAAVIGAIVFWPYFAVYFA